ncbi:hypothetical protein YC2023_050527 [Brassica napus]
MAITEFLLFVLTATLGGMFLCGANDLITIFVAPECFSLCSYLLSGYTKKDVRSNEATMKYLLMGGASSSILVHGFSWLYGSSGGEIELQEIVNAPRPPTRRPDPRKTKRKSWTVSGRQFLWGVGLPKGNGGVQRFPRAGRRLALECKGRRELDCKTHPSSRDESRP